MKAVVELIGEHVATGASSKQSRLGSSGKPGGQGTEAFNGTRLIAVSGIAGGSVVNIEGSLDGTTFYTWISGVSADGIYIVDDGPMLMRSNCTTYGSGTVSVTMQKFVND